MKPFLFSLFLASCASSQSSSAVGTQTPEPATKPAPAPQEAEPTAEEIQQRTSEPTELANQGGEASEPGNLSEASALLREAIRVDGSNHKAWFNIGLLFEKQKEYLRASEAYGHAARLQGNTEMYHYKLGQTLWKASPKANNSSARAALEQALQLNAKMFNAHFYLGLIYQKQNLHQKAAQSWTTALSINPTLGPATNHLAALYVQWRKMEQAIAVLNSGRKWVRDPAPLATIHYTLGHVYELQGDWSMAIAVYSKALEIVPDDRDVLRQRGFAYAEIGDTKAATSDFQRFLKHAADADPVLVLAVETRLFQLAAKNSKSHAKTVSKTILSGAALTGALPKVPEFKVPAIVGGAHRVDELLFQGDRYLDTEIKIRGKIVWVYDCAKAITKAGMSKKEVKRLLAEYPERCQRPHFQLADKRRASKSERIEVVDVPRKMRPDERRSLPKEIVANWPTVPTLKVGQEVVVSGRWATQSPFGFMNTEGFLIYKSITRVSKSKN